MADKQVIKRAKYKSSVKDPGVAGVLKMLMLLHFMLKLEDRSLTNLLPLLTMNNLAGKKQNDELSYCKKTVGSELQTLHKQFVYGGILTEAEFWATRKMSSWEIQGLLLKPLSGQNRALDAAFAYYDADVQKRSGKSGERPNGSV
ncbi:UNVERIFIED_CONTAM: hypothetical protein Sradi_5353200 [Sesamum radiatum]|uniref:Uncharacterized protein n=1 Tax=Sesamum radiatum TaxID=300843 RepID=A0AAW2LQB2_SESRA